MREADAFPGRNPYPLFLPPALEELPHQFHAFHSEHALQHFHAVIEHFRIGHLELAADAAEAQIADAKDQPRDACRHQCPGTHHAGFERAIERGVRQTIVSGGRRRLPERQDLGMGGRVVAADRRIPRSPLDLARDHDHRSHGHLAADLTFARQAQGLLHKAFVGQPILAAAAFQVAFPVDPLPFHFVDPTLAYNTVTTYLENLYA